MQLSSSILLFTWLFVFFSLGCEGKKKVENTIAQKADSTGVPSQVKPSSIETAQVMQVMKSSLEDSLLFQKVKESSFLSSIQRVDKEVFEREKLKQEEHLTTLSFDCENIKELFSSKNIGTGSEKIIIEYTNSTYDTLSKFFSGDDLGYGLAGCLPSFDDWIMFNVVHHVHYEETDPSNTFIFYNMRTQEDLYSTPRDYQEFSLNWPFSFTTNRQTVLTQLAGFGFEIWTVEEGAFSLHFSIDLEEVSHSTSEYFVFSDFFWIDNQHLFFSKKTDSGMTYFSVVLADK